MNKTGVLLINLGTPDNCDLLSVYRYLTEFLNDPRVIDIRGFLRGIVSNLIIVPLRFTKSAHAYQKIWSAEGSPLLVNSQKLRNALAVELGHDYQVEIAMRYGSPSIKTALKNLQKCNRLIAVPLFPQYSSAATGSAIAKLLHELAKQWNIPEIKVARDFYNNAGFIRSYAEIIKKNMSDKKPEVILFSYHGLPERHINKSDCQTNCNRIESCPRINADNLYCYRAQCYATSHLLAAILGLERKQYYVAFQSRLGRIPWIKPYTDATLTYLRQQGVKNIAIVCPSFVADCLETLEEINIRAREQWVSAGGNEFIFIPCLNEHITWIKSLADIVRHC